MVAAGPLLHERRDVVRLALDQRHRRRFLTGLGFPRVREGPAVHLCDLGGVGRRVVGAQPQLAGVVRGDVERVLAGLRRDQDRPHPHSVVVTQVAGFQQIDHRRARRAVGEVGVRGQVRHRGAGDPGPHLQLRPAIVHVQVHPRDVREAGAGRDRVFEPVLAREIRVRCVGPRSVPVVGQRAVLGLRHVGNGGHAIVRQRRPADVQLQGLAGPNRSGAVQPAHCGHPRRLAHHRVQGGLRELELPNPVQVRGHVVAGHGRQPLQPLVALPLVVARNRPFTRDVGRDHRLDRLPAQEALDLQIHRQLFRQAHPGVPDALRGLGFLEDPDFRAGPVPALPAGQFQLVVRVGREQVDCHLHAVLERVRIRVGPGLVGALLHLVAGLVEPAPIPVLLHEYRRHRCRAGEQRALLRIARVQVPDRDLHVEVDPLRTGAQVRVSAELVLVTHHVVPEGHQPRRFVQRFDPRRRDGPDQSLRHQFGVGGRIIADPPHPVRVGRLPEHEVRLLHHVVEADVEGRLVLIGGSDIDVQRPSEAARHRDRRRVHRVGPVHAGQPRPGRTHGDVVRVTAELNLRTESQRALRHRDRHDLARRGVHPGAVPAGDLRVDGHRRRDPGRVGGYRAVQRLGQAVLGHLVRGRGLEQCGLVRQQTLRPLVADLRVGSDSDVFDDPRELVVDPGGQHVVGRQRGREGVEDDPTRGQLVVRIAGLVRQHGDQVVAGGVARGAHVVVQRRRQPAVARSEADPGLAQDPIAGRGRDRLAPPVFVALTVLGDEQRSAATHPCGDRLDVLLRDVAAHPPGDEDRIALEVGGERVGAGLGHVRVAAGGQPARGFRAQHQDLHCGVVRAAGQPLQDVQIEGRRGVAVRVHVGHSVVRHGHHPPGAHGRKCDHGAVPDAVRRPRQVVGLRTECSHRADDARGQRRHAVQHHRPGRDGIDDRVDRDLPRLLRAVHRDRDGGLARVAGRRRPLQPVQRRVDLGLGAGERHGRVVRSVADRERHLSRVAERQQPLIGGQGERPVGRALDQHRVERRLPEHDRLVGLRHRHRGHDDLSDLPDRDRRRQHDRPHQRE